MDSVIAIRVTTHPAERNITNVGSVKGKKDAIVIVGKNEYIFVIGDCSLGWAGGLIKSLKEMVSVLCFKNIKSTPPKSMKYGFLNVLQTL